MATQVVMPKLSPPMEEGQLARWLKKEGDKFSRGEPLAEIDTDKATMEMQALANGVLRKILIGEGESAPLGQAIAIIGEADEDIAALVKTIEAKPAKAPAATAEPTPPAAPANKTSRLCLRQPKLTPQSPPQPPQSRHHRRPPTLRPLIRSRQRPPM